MFLSQLGPDQRDSAISQLGTEQFDILVIGGGVNGVGAALDAAARGLKVALIEAQLAGKPVVATDVGSVSEVILNHETGIVTNKNAGSIASAAASSEARSPTSQATGCAPMLCASWRSGASERAETITCAPRLA